MPYSKIEIPENATTISDIENDDYHHSHGTSRYIRSYHRGNEYPDVNHRYPPLHHSHTPPVEKQMECIITCASIYNHISSCPVCRQMYKQDNTVYLLVIAVLVIFCILLFKKAFIN